MEGAGLDLVGAGFGEAGMALEGNGRTVAVVEAVTVRWAVGLVAAAGREGEGEGEGMKLGDDGAPSRNMGVPKVGVLAVAGEGEAGNMGSGSAGEIGLSCVKDKARDGDSTMLSLLEGRAKGLVGRAEAAPSCEGRLTKGLCFSGDKACDGIFVGDESLVGEGEGVLARTLDGEGGIGDSGRRKGEGRGEEKDMGLDGDCD